MSLRLKPLSEVTDEDLEREGLMMPRKRNGLPEGWERLEGVSCAGWDIWLGFSYKPRADARYAIFRRQVENGSFPDEYIKASAYPNGETARLALADIRQALHEGRYEIKDLFPLAENPNFGRF